MTMKVTRRDLLTVAGGGAVGILLTPAPWKLVDDLAIWTQNWSWIPRPPKGPETLVATACSLCPSGCAIDARCIGGLPVSLRAAGDGALCALGITGHHLPWHPARLATPVRIDAATRAASPVSLDSVVAAASRAMRDAATSDAELAVLDMRPGRSVSWGWRRLLGQLPHASVLGAPGREGSSLATLRSMTGAHGDLGLDLSVPRAILSFGAPLGEGRAADVIIRSSIRLIQVEPVRSRTAEIAGRWLPCRPGAEAQLAHGIANVLLSEGLADDSRVRDAEDFESWMSLVTAATPETVALSTGIAPSAVRAAARELAAARPALAVAGEQPGGGRYGAATEAAIFSLNLLLGGIESGAIVERAEIPPPFDAGPLAPVDELERLEDRSLSLLIIDASAGDAVFPWQLAERKLAPGAVVVALSPFLAGTAARATYVVPTAPFLESLQEMASPLDGPNATLSLSVPILPPRETTIDPAAFIRMLANAAGIAMPEAWANTEELTRRRVEAVHRSARGSVIDRAGADVAVASGDEMWDALTAGARWIDSPSKAIAISTMALLPAPVPVPAPGRLTLLPILPRDVHHSAAVSPVLTKLYRESGLRHAGRAAVLNPATAASLSLRDGSTATLQTDAGEIRVTIATDESVMPGIIAAIVGPEPDSMGEGPAAQRIIDLCPTDSYGIWRQSSAALMEG